MSQQIPEPDSYDDKEVFAFFGLAFYNAQVLEQGLVNLAVALQAKGIGSLTIRDVVDLFENAENKTFGNILNTARKLIEIPSNMDSDLQTALGYRNRLAHGFFVDHSTNMLSRAGRRKMIDELRSIIEFVSKVDAEFDKVWIGAWEVLGVDENWFEKQFEKIRRRAEADIN